MATELPPITKREYRWRLAGGTLPLYERHLRSLLHYGITAPFQSWIRTRLEWTLENQTVANPDGVLRIKIEDDDTATITVEPLGTLPTAAQLAADAAAFGTPWLFFDGSFHAQTSELLDATDTLMRDLAQTRGYQVELVGEVLPQEGSAERFIVSDEFGLVPLEETPGAAEAEFMELFDRLWVTR